MRTRRQLLAAATVLLAVGVGGVLTGRSLAENADWHTSTARVTGDPAHPQILTKVDGWAYAATGEVAWIDATGTLHDDGWPACLPVVPVESPAYGDEHPIRFASVSVRANGFGWRPIVMVDCSS
jgi:hypothetical protein